MYIESKTVIHRLSSHVILFGGRIKFYQSIDYLIHLNLKV
uniref:Uncharacterized protein n=1 Tax=Musa acuminata subsp. malaccensis TaxID=214687 RepID=A0A804HYQ3_MUSAM